MSTYKRTPETIKKSKLSQIQKILGEDCTDENDDIINEKFKLVSQIKSHKAKITELKNNNIDIEGLDFNQIKDAFSNLRKLKENQISDNEKRLRSQKRMITTLTRLGVNTENMSKDDISSHWSQLQKDNSLFRMTQTLKKNNLYYDKMNEIDIKNSYSKYISDIQMNRSDSEKLETSQKMIDRHKNRSKSEKRNIEEKKKKTNKIKYGFENVMQSPAIIEKSLKKSKSYRDYIFPSGRIIQIQGYEDLIIDFLLKTENEDNIIVDKTQMPELWYIDPNNKTRRYYPDIFLSKQNMLIEVKSDFLYQKDKQTILLKGETCKNYGFQFRLVVLKNRKSKIDLIID